MAGPLKRPLVRPGSPKRLATAGSTLTAIPAAPATPNTPSPATGAQTLFTLLSWLSARQAKADVYLQTTRWYDAQVLADGAVADWRLGETSGTTATNSSSSGGLTGRARTLRVRTACGS